MKRIIIIAVLGFVALGLLVFAERRVSGIKHETGGRVLVSASFYPLSFFSEQVLDGKGEVYNITPAGAEPHDYELSSEDRMRIERSDILVLNGGRLEAWGESMSTALAGSGTRIISTGDVLMTGGDPHVWLDPVLAKAQAGEIVSAIKDIDPKNSIIYEQNFQHLSAKLDALDNAYRTELKNCRQKSIIAAHEAFGYIARRYGFEQVSIAGLSPDAEPSPEKLSEIASLARKSGIKYIFFESLVSPKLAETIAREVGARTLVLNPLEGLTKAEVSEGKDYFTEMRTNLNNLKIALECQ